MLKHLVFLLFFLGLVATAQEKIQTGKASFYADKFEGRMTASGELFSQSELTAAHKTLPFGTNLKVTNLANNTSVVVIVNDRGPFVAGRIIDLSKAAAKILGFTKLGVTDVVIEILEEKENELILSRKKNIEEPGIPLETEFYHLKTERFSPKGFAVQVGSFEELANVIRLSNRLKIVYQEKITLQIKSIDGTHIYSILVGSFKNMKDAEKFKKTINQKHPGCFVVDFSKTTPSN